MLCFFFNIVCHLLSYINTYFLCTKKTSWDLDNGQPGHKPNYRPDLNTPTRLSTVKN